DRAHVIRARKGAEGSGHPARAPQRRDGRELLQRGLDHGSLRGPAAHDRRGARGRARDLRGRNPQPGRVERAAGRDGLPAGRGEPDLGADQPAEPAARDQVRRPRAHGPARGGQVGRDLPADHPGRAVPPLRRAQREPGRGRASAAGGEGRPGRRDDGQRSPPPRLGARVGPPDVRGAGAERGAPGRQRQQPTARQPFRLARRRSAEDPGRRPDRLAKGSELLEPSDTASSQEEDVRATAPGWRGERVPRADPRGTRGGKEPSGMSADIDERLEEIRNKGLYRGMRWVSGPQGPRVLLDGKPVLLLCSNNYLGLADHPRVREAAAEAAMRYGAGSGASRLISGNMTIHRRLEEQLAQFKHSETALLFGSGYLANAGVVSTLAREGDVVFSDELNHASIIDGCRLSRAETFVYDHCDTDHLEWGLRQAQGRGSLIVTDGVFSMDGDVAPLERIVELGQRYDARVMVD